MPALDLDLGLIKLLLFTFVSWREITGNESRCTAYVQLLYTVLTVLRMYIRRDLKLQKI